MASKLFHDKDVTAGFDLRVRKNALIAKLPVKLI